MRKIYIVMFVSLLCLVSLDGFTQISKRASKKEIKYNKNTEAEQTNRLAFSVVMPKDCSITWTSLAKSLTKRVIITYGNDKDIALSMRSVSDLGVRNWNSSEVVLPLEKSNNIRIDGLYKTIYGMKGSYPLFFVYADTTLKYHYTSSPRSQWLKDRILHPTVTKFDNVIGVIKSKDADMSMFINTKNNEGNNCVMSITSSDNGVNWKLPDVAVKHNILSLRGWSILYKNNNKVCYMILTDNDGRPYVSHSNDGGNIWSYPALISEKVAGVNFKMAMNRGLITIFYQPIENDMIRLKDDVVGDIVMWQGSSLELLGGNFNKGNFSVIVDNDFKNSNVSLKDAMGIGKGRYIVLYTCDGQNGKMLKANVVRK